MSGARKRWISAEVEALLVAQLDREAEARGISRSEAIRRALARWTSDRMEEDEGRITRAQEHHRQVMNRLDFVVGMLSEQDRRIERLTDRGGAGPEEAPTENGPLAEARKRARRTVR